MKFLRPIAVAVLFAAWLLPSKASAASQEELKLFREAHEAFKQGGKTGYESADKEFGEFVVLYPSSEQRISAILLQAQARYQLGKFAGAIELLTQGMAGAKDKESDYLYWLGLSQLRAGDPDEAVRTFARVTSPEKLLPAALGEAEARLEQGDYAGVVDTLGATNSPLQEALKLKPEAETVVHGELLLVEAQFKLRHFSDAHRALEPLGRITLQSNQNWQRLWLEVLLQREEGLLTNALATASNLVDVARQTGSRESEDESNALLGGVLRQLDRPEEAIRVLKGNLSTNTPATTRQQALVRIAALYLEADRLADATNELREYTSRFPQESSISSLITGEIRLREYARLAATTNVQPAQLTQMLAQAHATLDTLAVAFTNSELQGRIQWLLGWCFWEEGNLESSARSFQAAAERLPLSSEQIMAKIKLADAESRLGRATNAVAAYRELASRIGEQGDSLQKFREPLLYQWLQASLQAGDFAGATNALQQLLLDFPFSYITETSVLVAMQSLGRSTPAQAREWYRDFASRYPNARLLPEMELVLARTYEQEGDWSGALKQYDSWLSRFGDNTNRPLAEYSRALCIWHSGDTTNAFVAFTLFVERYTNDLTPLALFRIAEHHFNEARYEGAETNYARIFVSTNWAVSELTLRARLEAGRSAFARTDWGPAREHFTNLVNLLPDATNAPPELTAWAYLRLGDTIREQYFTNRSKEMLDTAVRAYRKVTDGFNTNRLAAIAWGQIGAAYFQHAAQEPGTNYLNLAIDAWQRVSLTNDHPLVGVALRSQAEVAIGLALEKLAELQSGKEAKESLLKDAQEHYGNVIRRKNLLQGEDPDPDWYSKAVLQSAWLAEAQGDFRYAANVLLELARQVPVWRAQLETRIAKDDDLARGKTN